MRHPGYFAMLISIPASALAIGSWLSLIPAAGFKLTVLRRVRTEDGFLHKHLPGYADYAHRVPGALIRSRKQAVFDHAISGWESENG